MSKSKSKSFEFTHTFRKPRYVSLGKMTHDKLTVVVKGTGCVNSTISTLEAFERYEADIDSITYEGSEVLPVLRYFDEMEEVEEEAMAIVAGLFQNKFITL